MWHWRQCFFLCPPPLAGSFSLSTTAFLHGTTPTIDVAPVLWFSFVVLWRPATVQNPVVPGGKEEEGGGRRRKRTEDEQQQSVVFPFHQFNHPTDQTYRAVPSGGVTGDKTTGVSSPVPCFGVARHQTLIGVWVVGRQCFVVVQHGFTHHLRQRGRPQGFTVFSLVQRSFAHPNFRAIGVVSEKPAGGERERFFL